MGGGDDEEEDEEGDMNEEDDELAELERTIADPNVPSVVKEQLVKQLEVKRRKASFA